jgi:hypothetical protein
MSSFYNQALRVIIRCYSGYLEQKQAKINLAGSEIDWNWLKEKFKVGYRLKLFCANSIVIVYSLSYHSFSKGQDRANKPVFEMKLLCSISSQKN